MARWAARTEVGRRLFPAAVARAGFTFLLPYDGFHPEAGKHILVIGAASWSDPDLLALDRLAINLSGRAIQVVIFDVDYWQLDDIVRAFPGAWCFKSTPVVLQYDGGALNYTGEGHDAVLWLDQI